MTPAAVRTFVCGLIAIALSSAAPALAPVAAAPDVVLRDGRLTVDVFDMPVATLIERLRSRAGIDVVVDGSIDGSITASFSDLPVADALRRLFGRDASLVLLYSTPGPAPVAPSEVRVIPRGTGGASRPAAETQPSALPGFAQLTDQDAGTRTAAIESIADAGDSRSVEALSWVLTHDQDESVRMAAASALARLGSPEALRAFRQVLRDPSPGVRFSALDLLFDAPAPVAREIAREALRDPDEGVRAAAEATLEQLTGDSALAPERRGRRK